VTFRLSLDSRIFISQLTGDVHAEVVLAALTLLETMGAGLLLLCYAECGRESHSSQRWTVQW
jgi:hypothetical protein